MQRPPNRNAPPILFARGTSEWISRVNQKHKQFIELSLSPERKHILERWVETEFIYSTLRLEGADIGREKVSEIVSSESGVKPGAGDESAVTALLASLRMANSRVREDGKAANLTTDLLLKLHSVSGARFRTDAGKSPRIPKPPPPEHLPVVLESSFNWYDAESFTELNPVEQASIVLLRLIDLQPFEESNERTALVAASLFTLRRELPPIIIKPEMNSVYRTALEEATRMNTKPMVETLAVAIEKSLEELVDQYLCST